ncbi:hypothetical protein P152DRAFT_23843 [Eremomyces bilateralis CBS 781.70]|uniref:Uncharacterized protein n=1 Tax=Eremomyces bilateralis CBS 781.70 TaxID=1392243 RepID=A0A6G1GI17_9PEZI|nr:uncharacterized protein P152DRAFT_23843 [Eremomyces bilateralis CBS 781.70]KAF1817596.1 hypothetical protein P152DRAFT_23843 [Eremomyces bilateralis CBS 781.70]
MLEMAEQHFVAALACVERGREGSAGYFNASGENCRHGMEELDFIGRGDGNLQDEEMWFDSFAAYPYHLDAFMQTLRDHAHRIHLMRERVEARKLERVEEGRLGEMERESAPKARTKRLSHRSHMLEVEQGKEAVWEERDERMRRWATRRRFSATRYQELCRKALEEIVL